MSRKLLAIALAAVMIVVCHLTAVNAFADETDIQWRMDEAAGTLTFTGKGAIPDYQRSADTPWYAHHEQVKTIILGEGVTEVGSMAFAGYEKLESVKLPQSLRRIGMSAFSDCAALNNIDLPDSLTSIEGGAFMWTGYYNNESNWDGNVLYAGKALLAGRKQFKGAYIQRTTGECVVKNGTRIIADSAFSECGEMTGITLPDSLEIIGADAFHYCMALTEVKLPAAVASIGAGAFSQCKGLKSIDLPKGIGKIAQHLFMYCSSLKQIRIPASVREIEKMAFYNCEALERVVIENGATSIGEKAFYNCSALKEITIPQSVTDIEAMSVGHYLDIVDASGIEKTNEELTVICKKDSAAHKYALENGFAVEFTDAQAVVEPPVDDTGHAFGVITKTYTLGDLNGDGNINTTDARIALRAAAKLTVLSDFAAMLGDLNGDGRVNSKDARTILRIAAKLEPKPDQTITL